MFSDWLGNVVGQSEIQRQLLVERHVWLTWNKPIRVVKYECAGLLRGLTTKKVMIDSGIESQIEYIINAV